MIDDWYRTIELTMPFERWEQLPPFAGFKSEYYDGKAVWTPRPKSYNAVLDFTTIDLATLYADAGKTDLPDIVTSPVVEADRAHLPDVMAAAFHRIPPFCALPGEDRVAAAADCLAHTLGGGDGELLPDACIVARAPNDVIVGALLITRWKPRTSECDVNFDPTTAAHITWAFVRPLDCGVGVGTLMLREAVERLRLTGVRHLLTTFLAGNESSMLWHWRNGFRLLPYLGSRRSSPLLRRSNFRPSAQAGPDPADSLNRTFLEGHLCTASGSANCWSNRASSAPSRSTTSWSSRSARSAPSATWPKSSSASIPRPSRTPGSISTSASPARST